MSFFDSWFRSAEPGRARRGWRRKDIRRKHPHVEVLEDRRLMAVSYQFDVVAQATALGNGPSINDAGHVAYVDQDAAGESVKLWDGNGAGQIITGTPNTSTRYGTSVWLNNHDVVASRVQRIGTTIGTFIQRLYGPDSRFSTIATGGTGTDIFGNKVDDYDGIVSFGSLSNQIELGTLFGFNNVDGNLVYSGLVSNSTSVFLDVTPVEPDFGDLVFGSGTPFRPAIADDGRILIKGGSAVNSSIVLWPAGFIGSPTLIAGSSQGFVETGRAAGITNNGKIVAFFADLSAAGATTLGLTPGPGIFASIEKTGGRVIVRVAGVSGNGFLDPGETYTDLNGNHQFDAGSETDVGPFASFDSQARVGIATRETNIDTATIAMQGTDVLGNVVIYTARLGLTTTGGSVSELSRVAGVGDQVAGLSAVTSLAMFDPVNSKGQLVFHATLSSGDMAILRANPGPPNVLNVVTHGFGRNFIFDIPLYGSVEVALPFGDAFTQTWRDLGKTFDSLVKPGGSVTSVESYVSDWDSSDGWLPAAVAMLARQFFLTPIGWNPTLVIFSTIIEELGLAKARARAEGAAVKIVNDLKADGLLATAEQTQDGTQHIHLVGHSRGGAVNSRVARLLADEGYYVEQYTSLDGYSTDWPAPSNFLGDISIVDEIAAAGVNVGRKVNYQVIDPLDAIIAPYIKSYFIAVAPLLALATVSLGPESQALLNGSGDWRAPARAGFENILITSDNQFPTAHMEVPGVVRGIVEAYAPSATRPDPQFQFILDNYQGEQYRGVAPLQAPLQSLSQAAPLALNSATTSAADAIGRNFIDGSFEQLASLNAQIAGTSMPEVEDEAMAAWIQLLALPQYTLGTIWNAKGNVSLVDVAGDAKARLVSGEPTVLGQDLVLPEQVNGVRFDLDVVTPDSDTELRILFDGEVVGTVLLDTTGASGAYSVPLDAFAGKPGLLQFEIVVGETGTPGAEIRLDDLAITQGATSQLPPVAIADSSSLNQGESTSIDVLANDSDADDAIDPSTVEIVVSAAHGTATVNPTTGVIDYEPAAGFSGTDLLRYVVFDAAGLASNEASVFIEVLASATDADLAVTMTELQDSVAVNGQVTYQIVVTNQGPALATNVVLSDVLPAGVTFDYVSVEQGSAQQAGGIVTANLGDIASGDSVLVLVAVTANSPGQLTNSVEVTSDTTDPTVTNNEATESTTIVPTVAGYDVNIVFDGSDRQHRLLHNGFQFGVLITKPNGALIFRPHPDQGDPNGWGVSYYVNPYLSGGEPSQGDFDEVTSTATGIQVVASGNVVQAGDSSFGNWSWTVELSYDRTDPTVPRVAGSGDLIVELAGTLQSASADLNLDRIASNRLVGVPRQPASRSDGNTGDTQYVDYEFAAVSDPRDGRWTPEQQVAHFPTDTSAYLRRNTVGDVNTVDTLALGETFQIDVARKPSLAVTLTAQNAEPISFGGQWDAAKATDFAADNLGALALVLRGNTASTTLSFAVDIEATPPTASPDFTEDDYVDFGDFALFSGTFLQHVGDNSMAAEADLNRDGIVGFGDFAIFAANFLMPVSGFAASQFQAVALSQGDDAASAEASQLASSPATAQAFGKLLLQSDVSASATAFADAAEFSNSSEVTPLLAFETRPSIGEVPQPAQVARSAAISKVKRLISTAPCVGMLNDDLDRRENWIDALERTKRESTDKLNSCETTLWPELIDEVFAGWADDAGELNSNA